MFIEIILYIFSKGHVHGLVPLCNGFKIRLFVIATLARASGSTHWLNVRNILYSHTALSPIPAWNLLKHLKWSQAQPS
jgi:hypothetical protein